MQTPQDYFTGKLNLFFRDPPEQPLEQEQPFAPTAPMAEPSPIRWEDPRFAPEIEKVRKSCNVTHTDDDAMIGMCASLCQRQDSCEQQASS